MQDQLDLRALRDIGLTHHAVQAALAAPRPDGAKLARVIDIARDHASLHDGHARHEAVPWPTLRLAFEAAQSPLVVGDWVWHRPGAPGERGWILARLPAHNRLSRRDPAGGRQGLVANIDLALIVMGLDHDFNLRRLDRFLVLAQSAAAPAVVVLTKSDGCADPDGAVARVCAHLGCPATGSTGGSPLAAVVAVDARSAGAATTLAPWMTLGRTLVLLGSSGAGKTTLTNTLAATAAPTQAVRESDGRGQHTTTARTLHRTAGGACLIDTPGLRQLWLDVDDGALQGAFGDIAALAARCHFRDCRHESEPGCAVRGAVAPQRLESYRKLLRESRRDRLDVFERRRQGALYKQRAREARRRLLGMRA